MAQKTTLKEFESVYPKLEEAILEHARSYKLPQSELDWLTKVSCANEVDNNNVVQIANFIFYSSRTSKSTLSAANATVECLFPTLFLHSSASPSPKSNTSAPLLLDG